MGNCCGYSLFVCSFQFLLFSRGLSFPFIHMLRRRFSSCCHSLTHSIDCSALLSFPYFTFCSRPTYTSTPSPRSPPPFPNPTAAHIPFKPLLTLLSPTSGVFFSSQCSVARVSWPRARESSCRGTPPSSCSWSPSGSPPLLGTSLLPVNVWLTREIGGERW